MSQNGTSISLPLRLWLVVEVMFGAAASLAVGLSPAETATNFAWPIQPVVMAAVLGAFYLTTAPLFVLALFARRWEAIRVIILPAVLFTGVQLIVTLLHFEKFTVGSLPFYTWFASYLLPPPIFLAAYLWHQRRVAGGETPPADLLPEGLRRLLALAGGTVFAAALAVFVHPPFLMPHFAWKLTPLTTRTLCGWLLLAGAVLLSLAHENSRTRSRLISPTLFLALPLLLLQMSRYAGQVDWSNKILWLGLAFYAALGAVGAYLARGSWRETLK